jgi:hypothetical protein
VKDGSGALYDFAGQGQNHKSGANSLTHAGRGQKQAEGTHKTYKNLDFQPHNPLKFKREGSRVKNLDGLQKFINFAL